MYFCINYYMDKKYKKIIDEGLREISMKNSPNSLYEPIKYFFNMGGKRIRPILTLLSCKSFGGNFSDALNAALSVETFHNFTLIHDDIMDSSSFRRGLQTVHKKWGVNNAILSGDVMLILAYQLLEEYDSNIFLRLNKTLNKTAIEVCEGQQMDIDFETSSDVNLEDYLRMIKLKTAVLLGCALKMGAIVANANEENSKNIYDFGINLGLAFQLQDDYLDVFGEQDKFGKKIGGDITENKKTILFHYSILNGNENQKKEILDLYNNDSKKIDQKISKVKSIFKQTKADVITKNIIKDYTKQALNSLKLLTISDNDKKEFESFAVSLMKREL